MVLESLLTPKILEKKPWKAFFASFFYSFIGFFLAYSVFNPDVSLAMVFLTTMACVPLLVSLLKKTEREEILFGRPLIRTHTDVLATFFFMFMGMLSFFTLLATILPSDLFEQVFEKQMETINYIGSLAGSAVRHSFLELILINNFKVLFFVIIFSFLYGAGAIFILAWNASVLGTAIGDAIRSEMSKVGLLQAVPLAIGRYMLHGTLEVVAYFLGAIAGGIISAAVVRHDYRSPKFKELLRDSVNLIVAASIVLVVAGLLEVGL